MHAVPCHAAPPPLPQIARREPVLLPGVVWGGLLPLSIVPVEGLAETPGQLSKLMTKYSKDRYMLRLAQVRVLCDAKTMMSWGGLYFSAAMS